MNRNPVRFAKGCQPGQVHIKRRVPVVLRGGFAPVHFNRGVHHGPVELKANAVALPFRGNENFLGIVADPAGKIAHIRLPRSVRRYGCADHAIVRQVHDGPG